MNQPVEDGHDDATNSARIDGIVEQTRADVGQGHTDDFEATLRQRFADADMTVNDEEIRRIVAENQS